MTYDLMDKEAAIEAHGNTVFYNYKGTRYALETNGSTFLSENVLSIRGNDLTLTPKRDGSI